jgi:cation transport ATPase
VPIKSKAREDEKPQRKADDLPPIIPFAISINRHARKVIWQNLSSAVAVFITVVISALGFSLPLPLGVVGQEGSTVLVCLNGLRLLAYRAGGTSNGSKPRI